MYIRRKKSCTTLDGRKPINNGINHLSTGAGFLPSAVCRYIHIRVYIYTHMCTYINICICMYKYMFTRVFRSVFIMSFAPTIVSKHGDSVHSQPMQHRDTVLAQGQLRGTGDQTSALCAILGDWFWIGSTW